MELPESFFPIGKDIFRFSNPSKALLIYSDFTRDILSSSETSYGFNQMESDLTKIQYGFRKRPQVIHFSYDYALKRDGYNVGDRPLAIWLEYEDVSRHLPKEAILEWNLRVRDSLAFPEYSQIFQKVQNHLHLGDCYQVNLTAPFYFEWDDEVKTENIKNLLLSRFAKAGAYSFSTYLPSENFLFHSHSPECLFQVYSNKGKPFLESMPIKGTAKSRDELLSQKNRAELDMITDLLRNDLSRISHHRSRVINRYDFLKVPKLIHLFSRIHVDLGSSHLLEIMNALFPGGSITGAPKKRVMEITDSIEPSFRSWAYGSTFLHWQQRFAANIHIRTSVFSPKERIGHYHAGGGITLLSEELSEFHERLSKVESFLSLIRSSVSNVATQTL